MIFVLTGLLFASHWIWKSSNPLSGLLEKEWLDEKFPESVDSENSNWTVLPFGYTLGPWPRTFRQEPVLTELNYHKGPPKKFIQSMTQLWTPVEVELTLLGPKTLVDGVGQNQWKNCFESRFACASDKKKFLEYLSRKPSADHLVSVKWFDHLDPQGPRGIHLYWEFSKYRFDDFVLITHSGIVQGFLLKTVKSEAGDEARTLFYQILGNLKVKEELAGSRDWIQNKIRTVQLKQIQKLPSQKEKLVKLIETQTWLSSLLSVDPTQIAPFFHLAGVTHLLSLELIRLQTQYFQNQEAWILAQKPNLEQILKFSKDFENETVTRQIEDLLQDFLLQRQKASSK